MNYQVGIVGTGNPEQADGYAMAYRHARGYRRLEDCEVTACADIVEENALAFARTFDIDESNVYEEYEAMLGEVGPDVVSVCTPPKTHADIVIGCAEGSDVDAIHCEKPMAATWGGCREMVAACDRNDVRLTFNHQRRFAKPYRKAKSMLEEGRIGDLRRIEIGGNDLYDYGTHLFDMCGYLTDQTPVEWVLGQVEHRDHEVVYGVPQETGALARWHYESGVDGLASTGEEGMVDCELRLLGEEGVIEVGARDGTTLRVRVDGSGWERVGTGRDGIWRPSPHPIDRALERVPFGPDRLFGDPTYVDRAIADVVNALREGSRSELAAENALQTTEVIFACWESARRGGRVDLPLTMDGNPLEDLVDTGEPVPSDR
jgi:predicted dehydrogenase